ncbi:recombination protein NinG [Salmonella enterica]|nr:recombination protein NinG [Salmonella enterica]
MAKLPRRKCANKECRQWFHPIREGQIVCSYQCASAVGKEQTRKAREAAQRKAQSLQRAAEKKERAAWRQRKAAVKPLKHWIDLTQRAVNDICRETELAEGLGCISCGTKTAFAWHAGHYRSTAAAGHLRFTRFNIHLQCDVCNVYKSGNIEAYRAALVERYGEAAVLALENNNTPHRWTVEELKEIRLVALADLRALKKLEVA